MMLQDTDQDSITYVMARLNNLFLFYLSNANYGILKIINLDYFFSSIGYLTEGLSHLCQNMHTRIPKYKVRVLL